MREGGVGEDVGVGSEGSGGDVSDGLVDDLDEAKHGVFVLCVVRERIQRKEKGRTHLDAERFEAYQPKVLDDVADDAI